MRALLTVSNAGPAAADQVQVRLLPGRPDATAPILMRGDGAPALTMLAGEHRDLGFTANLSNSSPFICRLEWLDDDHRVDERTVDLPTD